jgi:SNW domain-containing protein 1
VPPYGKRGKGFVPREPADFGDGGAFPEVHAAQFPLNMGKKDAAPSTAIVSVDVGADGAVNFDAIVKQGTNRNKIVHSKLSDLKGGEGSEDLLAKPSAEEEAEQAAKTKNALEALIGGKIAAARPVQHAKNPAMQEAQYVRYTPNPNAPGFNPNAKQRVVELVEAQVDPMEPARHKHKKVPRGPPEDPVPVMHSPPRKVGGRVGLG